MTDTAHYKLIAPLILVLASALVSAQGPKSYTPVTDDRLANPEPANWLMYRGSYDGWGHSPLDQINTQNVKDLVPVWSFSTGVTQGHESPPIVNDGIMFITTPQNRVLALDAKTGNQLWLYERELPDGVIQWHQTNRGVGLYEDKVYFATLDAYLVALDARSGEVVWESAVEDYRKGYYMTLAPLVASGKVMVGVSGGEFGIRGFVQAFDAQTGKEVWKTYTIPGPGDPGHETWPGNSWETGGAPVWITGSYDPQLNLTYWGTGNPGPWTGDTRSGDNLYANSVIALDADTGDLKAYHQYHWNGSWDWDEVAAPILMDVRRNGRTLKGLVHAARSGYLWLLERSQNSISFVEAQPYVRQNVFTRLDPTTGRPEYDPSRRPGVGKKASFCPSWWGGKDWPPAAYNPGTGYVYIPANENLCSNLEGQDVTYKPGLPFMGAQLELTIFDGADHIGELQAWDINSGQRVWTHEFQSPLWGPVLTTAGGLVFMGGTNDRYFRAFNARTGEVLWKQRTNSGIIGVPSSYSVDGIQYVAVQSGWGVDAHKMQANLDFIFPPKIHVPQGGVLWVFALRQ